MGGKSVKIQKRNENRSKLNSKDWILWGVATAFLAIFLGIVSGTSGFYLGTQPIGLGLYMDWQLVCYVIAFAVYGIISVVIFRYY